MFVQNIRRCRLKTHSDIEAGTVGVKDFATGDQVDIAADAVVAELISRLRRQSRRRCSNGAGGAIIAGGDV